VAADVHGNVLQDINLVFPMTGAGHRADPSVIGAGHQSDLSEAIKLVLL
jgi:hypothetical protein